VSDTDPITPAPDAAPTPAAPAAAPATAPAADAAPDYKALFEQTQTRLATVETAA